MTQKVAMPITLSDTKIQGMAICVRKLTCLYYHGEKKAGVEDISFDAEAGSFVGIYGRSGVGKSILTKQMIFGRSKHCLGEILLDGNSPEQYINNEIAYYPQSVVFPELLTCMEFLALANADRGNKDEYLHENMDEILSQCALDRNILGKKIGNLSGGEQRRLGLAATLLETHLRMLIADEPTTGMDPDSEWLVMRTMQNISRRGVTVLTITHSIATASLMDRILVLYKKDDKTGARISYYGIPPKDSELHTTLIDYINGKNETDSNSVNDDKEMRKQQTKIKNAQTIIHENLQKSLNQILQWFLASLKLIYRDKKSLFTIVILAIICLLAIQIGTCSYTGNNSENTLLTLCSLAAPWLCAMFGAVFLAEFRPIYSWEAISGLKAHSFLFGTLLAQLFPSFFIALIFSVGLFVAPNTNCIIKNCIGKIICSEYTYDIMMRNDDNLIEYLKQKDTNELFKIVKSLYDSNQNLLLKNVLEKINEVLEPEEQKTFANVLKKQCPGIIFSNSTFNIKYTRIDSLSHRIPWFKENGKTQLEDGKEYMDDNSVLPFNASVIEEISDMDFKESNLKETIEYLYWHHDKELLICLLDYVSMHDIDNWRECVKECSGIVVNKSGKSPHYTMVSWCGTPCFPKIISFIEKGNINEYKNNNLLLRIINIKENHSVFWNPLKKLITDIANDDNINYPIMDKSETPFITIKSFIKVLLIIWCISMIGSTLGMTGTAYLGKSREATVFVLVLFVAFIIFSRLFITNSTHVSYLQPFIENLKVFRGIRYGESGILLPIAISFLCLGRYASNLVAYCFTKANLSFEYLYMILVFCLCMLISLFALRKGNFTLFQKK